MITEIGQFVLILAFLTALVTALSPIGKGERFVRLADHGALAMCGLVGLAMLALMAGFLRSDFSLLVVASNSHSAKPLLYKFGGVWGNHEGSLLLWVLMLSVFAAGVALFGRGIPADMRQRVLAVMGAVGAGFLALMLGTSNPFARLDPAPFEGQDLNPLLQDPGLIFHPPMLYAGYVGFSVAFAFAMAALWQGKVDRDWAKWVRPWVLLAWVCLSIGITMGSWWAYYELGWGGWWYWDPVENASLMPWMTGTALLHSVIVVEKRGALKSWTVFLALLTFSLSLLGTFLVRSGVLTSVHAFATDPARGIAILALLAATIGAGFTMFAVRANVLRPSGIFAPLSRETGLILNNLFLVCAAATILVGTLFPIINDMMRAPPVSVGAPFYEATILPMLAPFVFLVGIGPFIPWRKAIWAQVFRPLKQVTGLLLIILAMYLVFFVQRRILAICGLLGGIWLIMTGIRDVLARLQGAEGMIWHRIWRQKGRFWGRVLGHAGLGLFLLGATGTNVFMQEIMLPMSVGNSARLGQFMVTFDKLSKVAGPNYSADEGRFIVRVKDQDMAIIMPQRRHYPVTNVDTTEAGIHTGLRGDIFITLGEAQPDGSHIIRIVRHPLVPWIWIGGWVMAFGGIAAMMDRRSS